jgi:tRNA(fMet)-specific endonuclease VapC
MTRYVLDSDILRLLRDRHPVVEARVRAVAPPDETVTTAICVHEAVLGWHTYIVNARTPANIEYGYAQLAETVRAFAGVPILGYTLAAIARNDQLKKLKLNIGKNDLRIAAIVLEFGATLVTRNLRDFRRVPGLTCEDWSV